jgi:hypothetical protein
MGREKGPQQEIISEDKEEEREEGRGGGSREEGRGIGTKKITDNNSSSMHHQLISYFPFPLATISGSFISI